MPRTWAWPIDRRRPGHLVSPQIWRLPRVVVVHVGQPHSRIHGSAAGPQPEIELLGVVDHAWCFSVRLLEVFENVVIHLDAVHLLPGGRAELGQRPEPLEFLSLQAIVPQDSLAGRLPKILVATATVGPVAVVVVRRIRGGVGETEELAPAPVCTQKQVVAEVGVREDLSVADQPIPVLAADHHIVGNVEIFRPGVLRGDRDSHVLDAAVAHRQPLAMRSSGSASCQPFSPVFR